MALERREMVAKRKPLFILSVTALALVGLAVPSSADHGTRPIVGPLQPLGDYEHVVEIDENINTDLAFWGNRAYMGLWDGFAIIDISDPNNPQEVLLYEDCDPQHIGRGNQGDVLVWEDILIRSWNSNTPGPPATPSSCDGTPVPAGFEGLHIFDISDESDPDLIGAVDLPQGSHTATLVPDVANGRLLVYNGPSSANNPGIDIVEVPLANPASAALARFEPSGRSCHDTAVFLGDVLRAVCAGGNGFTMWTMDPAQGGSLENPKELFSKKVEVPNIQDPVTIGHAASFTWDGRMFAYGHEPGGGVDDQCDEDDREINRTQFFYETDTGKLLGMWTMNPPQTPVVENCTIHNFNFIPTLNGRDIVVGAHYQAGTWVVDVTDPQNPQVIARADPPPLDPNVLIDGGAWSGYWYNGLIYESEITKGMHIFRLNIPEASPGGFRPEAFSNPQTQMESIHLGSCRGRDVTLRGSSGNDVVQGTSLADVLAGEGGNDRFKAGAGNDLVCGGSGNDRLKGGESKDKLVGQGGNDKLNGGPGKDRCIGGGGDDKAIGCEREKSL
jgi:RTX calcium-binding nonapeptide repeat (4 copies)/LVIVD repeat